MLSTMRLSLVVSGVVLLTGCSVLGSKVYSEKSVREYDVSSALKSVLTKDKAIAAQFREYQDADANKAFAVYWLNGTVMTTAFASDMVTLALANDEALNRCHLAAGIEVGCRIETSASAKKVINNLTDYPMEAIRYSDIALYDVYQKHYGHKALAGNLSGIFGQGTGRNEKVAQANALELCEENIPKSMAGQCYVIESE